ncbi:MAG: 3'-5' exonuclease [Deltaproteobacteria bacterium]|nr:3'-5' exonuclease [Deltaproteobacteria bacterium]
MIDLIFDTETTGLPNWQAGPDDPGQPHLVQLGLMLFQDRKVLSEANLLVYPAGEVSEAAFKVHGISTETARRYGLPAPVALLVFLQLLGKAERIVAHNLNFDILIIKSALWRIGVTNIKGPAQRICTMKSSKPVLKLPGKQPGDYKLPRLEEAYKTLVDPAGFEGAHDALADVRACARVLWALEDGGHGLTG